MQQDTHTDKDRESELDGDVVGAPVRDKVPRALCEGDAAADEVAVAACDDRAETLTRRERAAATEARAERDRLPDELCVEFEDGDLENAEDLDLRLLRVRKAEEDGNAELLGVLYRRRGIGVSTALHKLATGNVHHAPLGSA